MLALSVALLAAALCALASGADISFETDSGVNVNFLPHWAIQGDTCLGTACPMERVFNLYIGELVTGQDTCTWASSLAERDAAEMAPISVGGIDIDLLPLLATLYSPDCASGLSDAVHTHFMMSEGGANVSHVQVNVVESSEANTITPDTFSDFVCWQYPSRCAMSATEDDVVGDDDGFAETSVVNIIVDSWCESGCFAGDHAPVCECQNGGRCVSDGVCACVDGFAGAQCATRAGCDTDGCSGNGLCDAASGVCACDAGFSGARCEVAPEATPAPTVQPLPVVGHLEKVRTDTEWLGPFEGTVFPKGRYTHISWFSAGQVPREEPRHQWDDGSDGWLKNGTGYAALCVDYEKACVHYEVLITFPHGELNDANVELHVGSIGRNGELIGALTELGDVCRVTSPIGRSWDALKFNGTMPLDVDAYGRAFADNHVYTLIRSREMPDGHVRAQAWRFDDVLTSRLLPPGVSRDAASEQTPQGAAVHFVDERRNTLHTWLHYTAPLDFIELSGDLTLTGGDGTPQFVLPTGISDFRPVGEFDGSKKPWRTILFGNSKFSFWRFAEEDADAADVHEALRTGGYSITVHGSKDRAAALTGVIM